MHVDTLSYAHGHTQHWRVSAPAGCSHPFLCTEMPLPSLDPAQSCLLGEDLVRFPKTKTLGDQR